MVLLVGLFLFFKLILGLLELEIGGQVAEGFLLLLNSFLFVIVVY